MDNSWLDKLWVVRTLLADPAQLRCHWKPIIKHRLLQVTEQLLGQKVACSFSSAVESRPFHFWKFLFCFPFSLFSHWFINCQVICPTFPPVHPFPWDFVPPISQLWCTCAKMFLSVFEICSWDGVLQTRTDGRQNWL